LVAVKVYGTGHETLILSIGRVQIVDDAGLVSAGSAISGGGSASLAASVAIETREGTEEFVLAWITRIHTFVENRVFV
jgi:hypothetical protein